MLACLNSGQPSTLISPDGVNSGWLRQWRISQYLGSQYLGTASHFCCWCSRGSSAGSRYSRPNGPMAVTWVTYSPDFAQWKWDVLPGRTMTLPGGYASTLSPSN